MKIIRAAIRTLLLLSLSAGFAGADPVTIRILHLNDFHGFAEPYTPYGAAGQAGGIAWLAASADRLRREKPTLFLAAGDMIQGNNWANLSRGESSLELMNLLGLDAMVVGNHEFDFGQEVLKKRVAQARFPVLAANVEGVPSLKPFIIRRINGVRVALVGIVTEDTPVSTHPRNVVGLRFSSPAETLKRLIPELRRQADLIVVVSHIGYAEDRRLAEQVPGIDVIVGGHSHTRVDRPARVGDTFIVQAWEHGKVLGVLDLTVDTGRLLSATGRLEEIGPRRGEPDPAVTALVEKYRKQVDAVLTGRVAETEIALDGENVRRGETNLGDLVADIMRSVSGADAALINGGGVRASIGQGTILVKDVYTALPFDNYIVAVRLSGCRIREALEHGVARVETGAGAFPQVSGIVFSYDASAPAGSRVREVWIDGKPLQSDREYSVATNDFLAAGGDGYTVFGDAIRASRDFSVVGGMLKGEKLVYSDSGRWLRDVVIDWLREKGKIAPKVDGRIREIR